MNSELKEVVNNMTNHQVHLLMHPLVTVISKLFTELDVPPSMAIIAAKTWVFAAEHAETISEEAIQSFVETEWERFKQKINTETS